MIDFFEQRGVTVVELLIGVVVAGILLGAISILFGRGVQVGREQFSQVLATEDARVALERMSDTLRNSRNGDQAFWLQETGDYSIKVLTNINDDTAIEQVRYFFEDEALKVGRTLEGEEEEVQIITRRLRNAAEETPVFAYYNYEGSEVAADEATAENVGRVGITLLVDEDPSKPPAFEEVSTIVSPRGTLSDEALIEAPLWPLVLNFPADVNESELVELILTNPETSEETKTLIYIRELANGRLTTFNGDHYVNLNYQQVLVGGDLPGWYAWIGPVFLGKSGEQSYFADDKMPISDVCVGDDLEVLLETCEFREVSQGSLKQRYQPIVTYTLGNGVQHYIRDITFLYEPQSN